MSGSEGVGANTEASRGGTAGAWAAGMGASGVRAAGVWAAGVWAWAAWTLARRWVPAPAVMVGIAAVA